MYLLSKTTSQVNKHNMKLYMEAYANRKDITPQLNKQLKCDALLLVG